jgi:hypothetical protein
MFSQMTSNRAEIAFSRADSLGCRNCLTSPVDCVRLADRGGGEEWIAV